MLPFLCHIPLTFYLTLNMLRIIPLTELLLPISLRNSKPTSKVPSRMSMSVSMGLEIASIPFILSFILVLGWSIIFLVELAFIFLCLLLMRASTSISRALTSLLGHLKQTTIAQLSLQMDVLKNLRLLQQLLTSGLTT